MIYVNLKEQRPHNRTLVLGDLKSYNLQSVFKTQKPQYYTKVKGIRLCKNNFLVRKF